MHDDPKSPNIDWETVGIVLNHFWCHIRDSSKRHDSRCGLSLKLSGEAKISQLHLQFSVRSLLDQDIGFFDVPV